MQASRRLLVSAEELRKEVEVSKKQLEEAGGVASDAEVRFFDFPPIGLGRCRQPGCTGSIVVVSKALRGTDEGETIIRKCNKCNKTF